jgi:hypothetical protein
VKYSEYEKKICKERLEKFVAGVYETMVIKQEKYSCVVIEGFSPDLAILDYCSHSDLNFICIATQAPVALKDYWAPILATLSPSLRFP